GYFSLRLARAVGHEGRVFACEASPFMLEVLRDRIVEARARNVTPVLSLGDDPLLPRASCDLILIVDTFHHFPQPTEYLRTLARALRPGGRIVNIDFVEGEVPVGPPPEMKVPRAAFLRHASDAGLEVLEEKTMLPYQYFFVLGLRP